MSKDITLKILVILLLVWVVFAFSFTPIRTSNDVWWHLKTGKYIIDHNLKIPKHDIFTFTGENTIWINHEWLSEITFGWIYSHYG